MLQAGGGNLVQPGGGITLPKRDRKSLEEVAGSFPWWDPKTVTQEMANAGDGIDCFLTPAIQDLYH